VGVWVCVWVCVCTVLAGREKFIDNARAVAAGEVGPLNQYGGGVPGAPNGLHAAALVPYFACSAAVRAGRHPCGGAGVAVRRRHQAAAWG